MGDLAKQVRAIHAGKPVPCFVCGRELPITSNHLYRCYYCARYICAACSPEHFGGERPSSVEQQA